MCFVIMPFGQKVDIAGQVIEFDSIYERLIKPAVQEAEFNPVRCDEVEEAGFIHRKMLEHIWAADVAVVDISALNPNVFYELGVRHTLHDAVTVLLRRKGTEVPFNIANLNVIEYDETDPDELLDVQSKIVRFIRNGLRNRIKDSIVHEVLKLRVGMESNSIGQSQVYEYPLQRHESKSICIITGDIQKVRCVDVWVNSENTNMQMARFYDWSISSVIRYLGARRDALGQVVDDTIADELGRIMHNNLSVHPGTVIATGPGELKRTHNVQRVFHAAAVAGEIGVGYRPINKISACITNSLGLVDSTFADEGWKSILFPLMGAGVSPGDLQRNCEEIFSAAISYLVENPSSILEKVYFIVWTHHELRICQSVLQGFAELQPCVGPLPQPVLAR
jgi:O-acetyl-ADP-ribose deacetylase (regulator of RNase III)